MENLILEFLEEGDRVIFYFNNAHPLKAIFVKCSDNCVVMNNRQGQTIVFRLEDVTRFQKLASAPARQYAAPEKAVTREAAEEAVNAGTAAPAPANDDAETDSGEPAAEEEKKEDSNVVSIQSILGPTNLFELEKPEVAPVKVIGKVNLDEIEPKRRRHISMRNTDNISVASSDMDRDDYDDDSAMLPAMGRIMSIGPKFGFISSGDDSYYFNLGELMKGGYNDAPIGKDEEVVFTPDSNDHGKVAKAIHRPWRVNKHIRQVEYRLTRDMRNARLLAQQLVDAFPDDDTVRDELYSMGLSGF